MKRLISLSLALIFVFLLCFTTSADTADNNVVNIADYTIVFDDNTSFSKEEQLLIAQYRANYDFSSSTTTNTYGLMCTLFGHKTTTETIIVTEHCVRDTAPRCLETIERLTVCSRCDHTEIEVLNSSYMYCCN